MAKVISNISIDPNTPPGNEPLKQGPSRFHEIKSYLLEAFGFSGAAVGAFQTPFYFDTVNDAAAATSGRASAAAGVPITADGLATKTYVDGKTQVLTLGTSNFLDYSAGGSVPATFTWNPLAVYTLLVSVTGANTGPVTVRAGAGAAIPLVHEDGTALVAGDLAGSTVAGQPAAYLAIYDNSVPSGAISPRLLLVGFVGGTLTQPFILGRVGDDFQTPLLNTASPNAVTPFLATTKSYVDAAIGHPQNTALGATVLNIGGTVSTVWSGTITTPDDGHNYLLQASYWAWIERASGSLVQVATWLDANGDTFALSAARIDSNPGGSIGSVGGSGMSKTIFPPNTTITVNVRLQTTGGNVDVEVTDAGFPSGPPSALTLMLMRTT